MKEVFSNQNLEVHDSEEELSTYVRESVGDDLLLLHENLIVIIKRLA